MSVVNQSPQNFSNTPLSIIVSTNRRNTAATFMHQDFESIMIESSPKAVSPPHKRRNIKATTTVAGMFCTYFCSLEYYIVFI